MGDMGPIGTSGQPGNRGAPGERGRSGAPGPTVSKWTCYIHKIALLNLLN